MEGTGTYPGAEQEKELEQFLQFGVGATDYPDCLTPVHALPLEYRHEIEKGYSTGWKSLDYIMQGLRKGEVTVVTADTGAGKTTFCTQLMVNCAMQNISVWINSWEMNPATTMRKLASIVLRKPMKVCPFTPQDNVNWDKWCSHYKVRVNQNTVGCDINFLAKKLIEAKKEGIEIVMLDHLDYLVNSRKEKIYEAIDETVKRLHELAFGLQMHFLLICHPRQSSTGTEEIGMHALKGSASIKQYADNIIILHRCARTDSTSAPNKVKIKVTKNRMFGTEGATYLYYNAVWDGYEELREFS